MDIPIFNTFISPDAAANVGGVLASTFLSEGRLVRDFEVQLATQLGIVNPVAVNSGTSALHLALVLAGVQPGDEVICPAQTFVASALAIRQERACPVFADIQYETGNISPASIEEKITAKTRAIMVVHWGGMPCDMDEIEAIARKHDLPIVEDAAHALGATYKNRPIGSISDYTCFSFQAIKHVTTGDGGAIASKDPGKAQQAMARRWFGIDRASAAPSMLGERKYDIRDVGYKYHLNDYSAALGIANLSGFAQRLLHLRRVAALYTQQLTTVPGIQLFEEKKDRESAYWLFGFHAERREALIRALRQHGIASSVIHQRIDRNSVFGGVCADLVNQARFDETQLHIPIHSGVSLEQAQYIVDVIRKGW